MGQLNISGAIIAGPPAGGEIFPSAQINVPLQVRPNPLSFGAATSVIEQTVTSPAPNVYVEIPHVGAGRTVTQANFLYLSTSGPVDVRLTCDDGIGGDVVSTFQSDGLLTMQFSTQKFLKKVELCGSTRIQFLATGMR